MTDNDIIKALECCSCESIMYCEDSCPFYKKCMNDEHLSKYVLALINRQQAEIERLKAEADKMAEDYSNLVIEKDELFDEAEKLIKKAKAEAVKEFAEKVENEIDCQPHNKGMQESAERYRIKSIINNLLKEMVGEE